MNKTHFSPDGKLVIFSGIVPSAPPQPNWLDKVLGVRPAKANGDFYDWWSVPSGGSDVTRLTQIYTSNLYASVSPDKKHIVSYSRHSIFVMNPDGSGLTVLISRLNLSKGTISWIPEKELLHPSLEAYQGYS